MIPKPVLPALALLLALSGTATAQVQFSQEQVDQGRGIYTMQCESCHGGDLNGGVGGGPPLTGDYFLDLWADQPVSGLFHFIKDTMPADTPGSLSSANVANLIAYILQFGGAEAGTEPLSSDPNALDAITLERPAAN